MRKGDTINRKRSKKSNDALLPTLFDFSVHESKGRVEEMSAMNGLPFGLDVLTDVLSVALLKVMTVSHTIVVSPTNHDYQYEYVQKLDAADFPSANKLGCDTFGQFELEGETMQPLRESHEKKFLKCEFATNGEISKLRGKIPSGNVQMKEMSSSKFRFEMNLDLRQFFPNGPIKELIEQDASLQSKVFYTVNFAAPRVTETNGILLDSGKKVQWQFSAQDFSNPQHIFVEFYVKDSFEAVIARWISTFFGFFKDIAAGFGFLFSFILRIFNFLFSNYQGK